MSDLTTLHGPPLAARLEISLQQGAQAASKLHTEIVRLAEELRTAQALCLSVERERESLKGKLYAREEELSNEKKSRQIAEKARKVAEEALRVDRESVQERERELHMLEDDLRVDCEALASKISCTVGQLEQRRSESKVSPDLKPGAGSLKRPRSPAASSSDDIYLRRRYSTDALSTPTPMPRRPDTYCGPISTYSPTRYTPRAPRSAITKTISP
ncbi:hypothetical protein DFH09DRAFT_463003 [Mycena vulgaris]|nr:hypothetical protein DFH09DRAFT_463003 [Mycena vulgaris]